MVLGWIALGGAVVAGVCWFVGLADKADLKEEIELLWADQSLAMSDEEYASITKREEEYGHDVRNSARFALASAFVCVVSILTFGVQLLKHFNVI